MFSCPLGDDAALLPRPAAISGAYHELQAANHERLARWGWAPEPPTPEVTRSLLEESGRAWIEGAELPVAIAVPAPEGWQLVGTAGLRISQHTRTGDAWYWIDAAFEGRGLVSRAMTILLDQAFGPLGLARVTVHTDAANQRSRALAARLGFTEEGLHRQAITIGDQRHDEVVYGLLADEWRAHRTSSRGTDDRARDPVDWAVFRRPPATADRPAER
jgi:RimJ/RimL family protein N-acetyltransferase